MGDKREIKVAIIDMNNGIPNQGIRGITEILSAFKKDNHLSLQYDIFDLRLKNELPGIDYDVYISSGGPGSPFDGENEAWENSFFHLIDNIEEYNTLYDRKKYFFFICHSFQLACRKYSLGTVTHRKSAAFGVFPVTLTQAGENDSLYKAMPNPFYAVDSRDWQVIDTNNNTSWTNGTAILAIEKERPGINLERCIMSVRFSKEFIGTQFHPEADPLGMKLYLLNDEQKETIIAAHGEEKYTDMLNSLEDPDRILLTQRSILPNFLKEVIESFKN